MDSAAKTLSPTAESSMIHHAPPFISVPSYYFWLPRVLFWLFNFAHPIIRNLKRTSSRLFLLPGTAVCRTDRGGAHIGSVVATCSGFLSGGGGAPLLWLLYRNLWHSREQAKSEAPGADPRTLEVPERVGGVEGVNKVQTKGNNSLISGENEQWEIRMPRWIKYHSPFFTNHMGIWALNRLC